MAGTVRDALVRALDDLSGSSFKRFRNKLMDWDIKEGFNTIPKSKLEKADTDDVVELIVSFYKDCYGPELTVDVLNAINEKQVASDLKKALDNVRGLSYPEKPKEEPQPTSEASPPSAPEPAEEPFQHEPPRDSSFCVVC